jgi:hypothetical protein
LAQLSVSRWSYHVAKTLPFVAADKLGCHWARVVASVFNLNGVAKVTPPSVERM